VKTFVFVLGGLDIDIIKGQEVHLDGSFKLIDFYFDQFSFSCSNMCMDCSRFRLVIALCLSCLILSYHLGVNFVTCKLGLLLE